MKCNTGGVKLFASAEWCDASEIQGTDATVLTHPIMEEAFERVCASHVQRHDTALVALCTKSRPYSSTPTWKALLGCCEGVCDAVVTSNGGIVPIEFENEWPFLTYDAPGTARYDNLYIRVLRRRLEVFLRLFDYKKVVGVFGLRKRNRVAVNLACSAVGVECVMLPTKGAWAVMNRKVPGARSGVTTGAYVMDGHLWSPLAHPRVLSEVKECIGAD